MTFGGGDLDVLDETPLNDLLELVRFRDAARDLVDEQIAAAVARAREVGTSWGEIAAVLRGG
jgi:hypothetical protein